MFLLLACAASTETPASETPEPETSDTGPAMAAEGAAAPAATGALIATEAAGALLGLDEAADYAEDGELASRMADPEGCVAATRGDAGLTLTFEGCEHLAGSVTLTWTDGITTIVLGEGFAIDGHALGGTITADLQARARTYVVTAEVAVADPAAEVSLAVTLGLEAGVIAWGTSSSRWVGTQGTVTAASTLGSEAEPLRWEIDAGDTGAPSLACRCPTAGVITTDAVGAVSAVTLDLDDYLSSRDGVDDYPPLVVPLTTPAEVRVTATVTFGACGEEVIVVQATDLTVAVPKSDVEAAVAAACEDGDLSEASCNLLDTLLRYLPDPLTVTVESETIEAALASSVEAAISVACG